MRNSVNTPPMSGPSLAAAAGPMLVLGIVLSWAPATAEPSHGRESFSSSPAYAGSHGCQAVEECWRVSSEALAKEDRLRRIPPKKPKGPQL